MKYIAEPSRLGRIYLGLAYWANKNVRSAIETFEDAWNRNKTAKTLVRLSCLYSLQGSANIEIYKSGVVTLKKSWWAWQLLGAAYLREGNFGKTIELYLRALDENPDADWARDGLHETQRIKNMQTTYFAGKLSQLLVNHRNFGSHQQQHGQFGSQIFGFHTFRFL